MGNIKRVERVLPSHFASYLINGDASGLNDDDFEKIENFVAQGVEQHGFFYCLADLEDLGFCVTNDLDNLGNDCNLFAFQVRWL